MRVLYLSVWYPSRRNKMAGLFVQKHADAVRRQGVEVRVNTLWTHADVVQLNVLTIKYGLLALLLKRFFHIPYLIVEHWSSYLPQNGQFERFPQWKRTLLQRIAREASGIYPVSQILEDNMKRCGIENAVWGRVHNVVDDAFFQQSFGKPIQSLSSNSPVGTVQNPTTKRSNILHISCFDERSKNVCGLLRATRELCNHRSDFCLTLVGNGPDYAMCRAYADELNFPDGVLRWTGELSPIKVVDEMANADGVVLVSNYETYGIPIAEAMAMGKPSLTTASCGLFVDAKCGVRIPSNSDAEIEKGLNNLLDNLNSFEPSSIRSFASCFREEAVGKRLVEIYSSVRS